MSGTSAHSVASFRRSPPTPVGNACTRRRTKEALPWLRHYDSDVPHTLRPYPRKTLLDFVADTVRERPGHPFLLFKGARLSYAEVDRLSDAFAAALRKRGVGRGDRVALVLPNCPQAVICQLGAWKAGAIVVYLSPLYTKDELTPILQQTRPAAAVVLTRFYDRLKAVQAASSLQFVIATNIKEYFPPLLRVLFTLALEKKEGDRVALHPGDLRLGDLLRQHARDGRPDVAVACEDPALLMCTGGTTGIPKAAVLTHQAIVMTGMQIYAVGHRAVPRGRSVALLVLPLFHMYGAGVLATAIESQNAVALVPNGRDLDDVVATIDKVRPAWLPGIPSLYVALLNHPKIKAGNIELNSIGVCTSGAAPLMAETKKRFEAVSGGKVVEAYGLTESGLAMTCSPLYGMWKPGSVGIPAPDVEVRIVDPDVGDRELPAGEVGEVTMRAPNVMTGYWEAPDETAQVLRNGWVYTGDLGYMDEDGYLFIVDRKKDLMKPSGFQVWPREVEEAIAAHPSVVEVAVAGITDSRNVEAVKAWVVLKKGTATDSEGIRTFCRERLAPYKVPKYVEFREALPKSGIGKVLRRALRDEQTSPVT